MKCLYVEATPSLTKIVRVFTSFSYRNDNIRNEWREFEKPDGVTSVNNWPTNIYRLDFDVFVVVWRCYWSILPTLKQKWRHFDKIFSVQWWHIGSFKTFKCHEDVIKWKHFPHNWPSVQGIHGPGEFPTQRPVTRSFDVFCYLRLNKRLSK